MDALLNKLADNFPFAICLIIVVVVFLRAMSNRDKLFVAAITKVTDTTDERAKECHIVQRQGTEAMGKTTGAINEFNHHMRELASRRRRRSRAAPTTPTTPTTPPPPPPPPPDGPRSPETPA